MERLKPGPLADALREGRERCNTLFALARRQNRGLDQAEFAAHVCGPLDRLVRAIAEAAPAAAPRAAEELYALSLELFARNLLGGETRHPLLGRAWDEVLPQVAAQLAEAPRRGAAQLSNALCQIEAEAGPAAAQTWLTQLPPAAADCASLDQLLDVGLVLAWRCGLAQYRPAALATWRKLPAPLQRLGLGLSPKTRSPSLTELEARLGQPWTDPLSGRADGTPMLRARVGGFRGFGGLFLSPPLVERTAEGIVAGDGENRFVLYADSFGCVLKRRPGPMPETLPPTADADLHLSPQGEIRWQRRRCSLPGLAESLSWAATAETLAVTLPHSHYVFVVSLP